MTTLILGATGATGKHLVAQLLNMGQSVKVLVRPESNVPDNWINNDKITIIRAGISELKSEDMQEHLAGCHSVASCLGHNLHFKGIFGKPRKLVTNAVRLTCDAIEKQNPQRPMKFVLMNTTANRNKNVKEKYSFGDKLIIGILRGILPPQRDNEGAAKYLRVNIGQNHKMIEWVAVRPDTLINENEVSEYNLKPSPVRSPVFKAGKTSRINVGNFISRLITHDDLWNQWKGQMPVIYNEGL